MTGAASAGGRRPARPSPPLRVAALLAAALLGGCAVVGPDYQTPRVAVPGRWSGAAAAQQRQQPQLSQWWRRLNDPVLNGLIEEAISGNLDVATAKAKIREARATRREAVGGLFPTLSGSADAARNRTGGTSTSSAGAGNITYNTFSAGLDASWELDLFGANHRAVEAATYGVEAAEADLRATLVTLVGDVATAYVDARGYQARIALARRTASSQRDTAALTRTKFTAGSASAVDAANADAEAASTAANIPLYEQSFAQDVHQLSVLLGREPTALAERLKRTAPIPTPGRPLPTGIPADILLVRPDVREAERQLAQYTAKVGQAEAALYPSVSLTGSLSTSGTKIGDLAKNSSISWSFGPSVSVPIFQGGQLTAEVDIARAQRDQYFIALRSAVLTALQDVENALVNLSTQRRNAAQLGQAVKGYQDAARLAHVLYQAGSESFLDVLTADRSLYSAQDSLLQSRVAITKYYVALAKALGGGWDGAIDSSKPEVVDTNTGPHLAAAQN
ncbi:efflux transporter outer membrane subunit [Labrys wisconsinensis]|uniref:NodT family efflux transporter outer membrane factor (OMF) lipoprotein n=1 Tax=Labrys wisconsinensis TaxID=425677 RepID=A0ABU0JEM0_9HYPH|nr:efflux transporter outer membrane subunit [Labrys wisconsinensis]MDQ0471587.1 NodT family efflux transporter outer membrane factor (OMF) lipoprotein [Labrys wisconsinensis]